MQTIAQQGYTQQEVLDVLQFNGWKSIGGGSRETTFRYERLDATNFKLADMTNVIDCSINMDFTADVKRTASFTLLDDGSVNFASDRIKPWVRVAMPKDGRSYNGIASQYSAVKVGEYNFNEAVTGGGAVNTGIGGTGMNGVIGSAVVIGIPSSIDGSGYYFPPVAGSTAQVRVTNGGRFVSNTGGTGGFTVSNSWSHTIFFGFTPNTSLGKIWQTSTGSAYLGINGTTISFVATTATGTVSVSCQNVYGQDLAFIGVTRQVGGKTQIYLNGVPQPMTVTTDDPSNTLTGGGDLYFGGDANLNISMDVPTFYNVTLNDAQILELYRAGRKKGPFSTANFVEYPQGVFLLTAPQRDEDANKVVTRKVSGFSPEQSYVDDVVTTRYTAQSGTFYTNNILGLVLNYVPKNLGIQDPQYWNFVGVGIAYPPGGTSSVTIPGPTTSGLNNQGTYQEFTIANADVRMNATLPASGAGFRAYEMEAGDASGNNVRFAVQVNSNTNAQWIAANNIGTIAFGNYNATSMAYMRVWENGGIIFFQTSPDNASWTTLAQCPAWSYLSPTSFGPIVYNTGGTEAAWSVVFNSFIVSAALQAVVNVSPSTAFLPVGNDYQPGTTKLAIINDLLKTIGYCPLYHDENGVPQILPLVNPSLRPPEYVYSEDSASVTLPAKTEVFDLYSVPNVFVLVASNPDATLYTATYTNANPLSPTSTLSRGRSIVHYELETNAYNLVSLQARCALLAQQASAPYDILTFQSAIMPFHASNDMYGVVYPELQTFDKYNETKWSFQCKQGATMSHTAQRQVAV
jgi:hypothetical protein